MNGKSVSLAHRERGFPANSMEEEDKRTRWDLSFLNKESESPLIKEWRKSGFWWKPRSVDELVVRLFEER